MPSHPARVCFRELEDTMVFSWVPYALLAYFLGSVPFGRVIARIVARIDITQRGSKNIGATNVARELGLKWGLITLLLDTLKGFFPVVLFMFRISDGAVHPEWGLSVVGLSALLGHQFSLFERFRGGKGVATALGVYLALSPSSRIASLIALLLFILTVYKWDFISLGSMVSASSIPFILLILGDSRILVLFSAVVALLICLKHTDNIGRLVRREERKWRQRKGQPKRSKSLSSSSSE